MIWNSLCRILHLMLKFQVSRIWYTVYPQRKNKLIILHFLYHHNRRHTVRNSLMSKEKKKSVDTHEKCFYVPRNAQWKYGISTQKWNDAKTYNTTFSCDHLRHFEHWTFLMLRNWTSRFRKKIEIYALDSEFGT